MSRSFFTRNETLVALTILLFSAVVTVVSPAFLTVGNLFDLLRSSIVMGILAMGVLIVIISGGIDVSFTVIAVFAMYTTMRLMITTIPSLPYPVAFLIAGAIGLVLGLINAYFISRFRLPTLIVTLGTFSMFRGFMIVVVGSKTITDIPAPLLTFTRASLLDVETSSGGLSKLHPGILITLAVAIAVWLLLDYTMLGRGIYALGGSREAAERAGFNIARIQYFIYGLVGLLAGIAGMIHGTLNRQGNPYDLLIGSELNVIAAVVLGGAQLTGGRGTVLGALLGVILVVLMNTNLILLGIPAVWQRVVIGLIILIGTGLPAIQAKRAIK